VKFSPFPIRVTNQAIIVKTLESKSLLPSLYKREEFPSLEKRGKRRFS
jgi:hypothetical protein